MVEPELDDAGNWFARRWFAFEIVAVAALFCLLKYDDENRRVREEAERERDAKLLGGDGVRGVRVK